MASFGPQERDLPPRTVEDRYDGPNCTRMRPRGRTCARVRGTDLDTMATVVTVCDGKQQ